MDPKIRYRTSDELLVRKKEFLKICDILDSLKISYFLQAGVLLGIIRDNDFIKWDWDVEISIFPKDLLPNIDLIADNLKTNGFEINKINRKKDDSKIDFIGEYPGNVTGYTIYAWNYSKIRNVYWRREYSLPPKFLKSFSKVDFLGRQFNCPNYPEEYLKFVYGNWREPLRTIDKEMYYKKNYKSKTKFVIISIKQKFLKLIYDTWKFFKNFLST
jgi:lipopolysaccharide cholinephosphotransferase